MSCPLDPLRSRLLQMLLPPEKHQPRRAGNARAEPVARPPAAERSNGSLYAAWLASRAVPGSKSVLLTPGAQRPFSRANIALAAHLARHSSLDVLALLWRLYPVRLAAMIAMDVCKGVFPAFRGYSQALIINEFQAVISSGNFMCARLCRLIATELLRVAVESCFDSLATANEDIIQSSARFAMEYRQMEQRVRMDVPTLADPHIRDLFHESDLFVRSFSGVANFGLFSPLDILRILTLLSETFSHLLVLWSLAASSAHLSLLAFSVLSYLLPLALSCWRQTVDDADDYQDAQAARATAKQNKMRNMAHSDAHRPEVVLFGLGPWILDTWAKARKATLGLEQARSAADGHPLGAILANMNTTGLLVALQNMPVVLAMQSSSTALGSFTLYRSSVESIVFSVRQLVQLLRMAFQGVFLMGAFCAAMEVQPRLQPRKEDVVPFPSSGKGMSIEARNISFTYPGSREPAVRNVSFSLGAGETLAIVGYNGSGKSTLANILLRITDFDSGTLRLNGADARTLDPGELHARATAVFQGFARFDASVRDNVGVGFVPDLRAPAAVARALALAGADGVVAALPRGAKTRLDPSGGGAAPVGFAEGAGLCHRGRAHGLSGGEWQRIAISRAFMRARRPEVELLLLDEPTASLDAHAQNRVFETVEDISRSATGERTKTVIFITHRLSTARRADKIAMMQDGTITEFGTHDELLARGGAYAALYRASV